MRTNFVGERMTEAREARGYNRAQVAEALGITRQAVSQYERQLRTPTPTLLDNAAKFLRFPVHRFTRQIPVKSDTPQFFRSLATATKTARERAARRLDWVRHDICGFLRQWIEFKPVNFPMLKVAEDPSLMDLEDIELLAQETRRFWGLGDGPIADVVMLLENNGVVVVRQELGLQTLDAFSRWDVRDSTPYIVLGTDKDTAVRSRFNAAHELGHMILHRHLNRGRVFHTNMHNLL